MSLAHLALRLGGLRLVMSLAHLALRLGVGLRLVMSLAHLALRLGVGLRLVMSLAHLALRLGVGLRPISLKKNRDGNEHICSFPSLFFFILARLIVSCIHSC